MTSTGTFSETDIARVCHEANRVLQQIQGDPVQSRPWESETEETRASAIAGVCTAVSGTTAEEQHEAWTRYKLEQGRRAVANRSARTVAALADDPS